MFVISLRRWLLKLNSRFAYLFPIEIGSMSVFESDSLDEVELRFPIEIAIEAVPLSLQASARSRQDWKNKIQEVLRARIGGGKWATESPVSVTIFYFPDGRMIGDIDNIVKPILDALMPIVYLDDSQVDRILAQKFESDRAYKIENPSPTLATVLETEQPVVYVRVDNEVSLGS